MLKAGIEPATYKLSHLSYSSKNIHWVQLINQVKTGNRTRIEGATFPSNSHYTISTNYVPEVGLEPTTTSLRGWRSTD